MTHKPDVKPAAGGKHRPWLYQNRNQTNRTNILLCLPYTHSALVCKYKDFFCNTWPATSSCKEYCQIGFYPFFKEEDAQIRLQNAILATVEDDIPAYAEMTVAATVKLKKLMYILSKSVPFKPSNDTLGRDLSLSRNTVPDYIGYLEASGLFNALREPGHSDNLLAKIEKLYLGNSNIALSLSENGIVDDRNMRETNFIAWTGQLFKPTASRISDFEIDGITFEVGGKNKNGSQIKDAERGYLVKDNLEYASGKSIPIWMFGFLY